MIDDSLLALAWKRSGFCQVRTAQTKFQPLLTKVKAAPNHNHRLQAVFYIRI